jgi:hypothetical protein
MTHLLSGDLVRLDPNLLSKGEMLVLTDAPDPAYHMNFVSRPERFDPTTGASFGRDGNFVSAKLIPGSRVRQNDVLLVIAFNRAEDPSHALVIAGDHLGWIVLEHLKKLA